MRKLHFKSKERVIRDTVHGNIVLSNRFINIIDTPEFQRLRRIRQLSTAYFIFPAADHSRFIHSLGTYHVMNLIIDHFKNIFAELNITIEERSINLALAVALLHDIGHGPFSHAYESALPTNKIQKLHEEWTIDIILSPNSCVNMELINSFDEKFPEDLADLIRKEKNVKRHGIDARPFEGIDLFFVLSSLISSQLDADRMDYLLRDAFFTGVSYGQYDISRLIQSLTLTVYDNKNYVCVQEKYLSTVEEYLMARFQMHDSVYLHPFKVTMETMVKKILQRTYELYKLGNIKGTALPEALRVVFDGREMSVAEYITLDDSVMIALFASFRNHKDGILSSLCEAFLDRKKYKEISILNNTTEEIRDFETELIKLLNKYDYKVSNLKDEYFYIANIPTKPNNVIYKHEKDNIWVLKRNGTVCDLFEISNVITEKLKGQQNTVFLNLEMLKHCQLKDVEHAIIEIEELVEFYHNRNHIEIEKKYYFTEQGTFEKVLDFLRKWDKYRIDDSSKSKSQVDYYFDTKEKMLLKSNKILRIREKGVEKLITIKVPTKLSEFASQSQNERFEYETEISSIELKDNATHIYKYIPELKEYKLEEMLIQTLAVRNQRRKIILENENTCFEMVFDDVTFENNETGKTAHEYQIEIELKSEFIHRVNLKILSDCLEENILGLRTTTDSKYKRGCLLTSNN